MNNSIVYHFCQIRKYLNLNHQFNFVLLCFHHKFEQNQLLFPLYLIGTFTCWFDLIFGLNEKPSSNFTPKSHSNPKPMKVNILRILSHYFRILPVCDFASQIFMLFLYSYSIVFVVVKNWVFVQKRNHVFLNLGLSLFGYLLLIHY